MGLCGRSAERLAGAATELKALGARVSTSVADVRDYDALGAALAGSKSELGPADVLVCGAAGNFLARAETLNAKGFRTVVEIDLLGSFNAARAAFEQLQETKGSVIFISAGQSTMPFLAQAHVGAAKAGVDSLMRSLALEWGRFGIRANALVPGPIGETEGMKRLGGSLDPTAMAAMLPLGRFGTVDDIGAMAVVLASPLAAFVTGASIVVDGGFGLSGTGLFNQSLLAAEAGA